MRSRGTRGGKREHAVLPKCECRLGKRVELPADASDPARIRQCQRRPDPSGVSGSRLSSAELRLTWRSLSRGPQAVDPRPLGSAATVASGLDLRLRSQGFQEMCPFPSGCRGQPVVPLLQQLSQLFPQRRQLVDPAVQLFQPLADQFANAATRCTTAISHVQDALQTRQREPHHERSLDEQHAVDRRTRILAISGRRPHRAWKKSFAFVVPKGIRADPSRSGDVTRSHRRRAHRFRTIVESPVRWSAIWNRKKSCTADSDSGSVVTMSTRPPAGVST